MRRADDAAQRGLDNVPICIVGERDTDKPARNGARQHQMLDCTDQRRGERRGIVDRCGQPVTAQAGYLLAKAAKVSVSHAADMGGTGPTPPKR